MLEPVMGCTPSELQNCQTENGLGVERFEFRNACLRSFRASDYEFGLGTTAGHVCWRPTYSGSISMLA